MKNKKCLIPGCKNEQLAKGLCSKHYQRWIKYSDPNITKVRTKKKCIVPGCDKNMHAKGYCNYHYNVFRDRKCSLSGCNNTYFAKGYCLKHYKQYAAPRCTIDNCDRPRSSKLYCSMHYDRYKKYGSPLLSTNIINKNTCTYKDCNKPIHAQGYCKSHYNKLMRKGIIKSIYLKKGRYSLIRIILKKVPFLKKVLKNIYKCLMYITAKLRIILK